MAFIDYGALLRVDGKFVNKNQDLFMEVSDAGYVCEKAIGKDGESFPVKGNYFVYAGDEDCMAVFYKTSYMMISHEKIMLSEFGAPCAGYTYKNIPGMPEFTVSHLDKVLRPYFPEPFESWEEFVKENWIGATGEERPSELENGEKEYRWFLRRLRRNTRLRHSGRYAKEYTLRYLAEWDHAGRHYEVIFGYGIDPSEKTWSEIKDEAYDFTDTEKQIIDGWFAESAD